MDPIGRFERLAVAATRHVRRFYRYLTGDWTCLGFVRLMCVVVVAFDVVSGVAYLRDGDLQGTGLALLGSVGVLVVWGPQLFRAAASTDRSPIGPGVEAVKPDLSAAIDVAFTISVVIMFTYNVARIILGNPPAAGEALALLSYPPLLLAVWGPQDCDGGKGDRTLSKDLRRLARRVGPEVAGGHITRRPVPVPVDT